MFVTPFNVIDTSSSDTFEFNTLSNLSTIEEYSPISYFIKAIKLLSISVILFPASFLVRLSEIIFNLA